MRRFRLVVLSAVWLGVAFFSLDRVNISLAAPEIMRELGISGMEMGMILSLYFWGYLLGNPLGGLVADNFNIRRFATVMLGSWCIFTALTGLCRNVSHFYLVRGLFGLAEGAVIGPFNKLQNNWLLPQERGRYWGVYAGCAHLSLAFGLPLVGWLIAAWGWREMFYITGAITLLVVVAFSLLVRDCPAEHPWISAEEKALIEESLRRDRITFDATAQATPRLSFSEAFRTLAREKHFWMICFGFFLGYSLLTANLTWLPGYLIKERGYSVAQSGLALIIPYLMATLGLIFNGFLSDRVGNRCLIGVIFWLVAGPAMIATMLAPGSISMVALAGLTLFFAAGPLNSTYILLFDIFPAEVTGTAIGIVSASGGAASGIVAPLVIGYVYDTTGSFFWGFALFAGGALLAGILFIPLIFWEKGIKEEKARRGGLPVEASAVRLN